MYSLGFLRNLRVFLNFFGERRGWSFLLRERASNFRSSLEGLDRLGTFGIAFLIILQAPGRTPWLLQPFLFQRIHPPISSLVGIHGGHLVSGL